MFSDLQQQTKTHTDSQDFLDIGCRSKGDIAGDRVGGRAGEIHNGRLSMSTSRFTLHAKHEMLTPLHGEAISPFFVCTACCRRKKRTPETIPRSKIRGFSNTSRQQKKRVWYANSLGHKCTHSTYNQPQPTRTRTDGHANSFRHNTSPMRLRANSGGKCSPLTHSPTHTSHSEFPTFTGSPSRLKTMVPREVNLDTNTPSTKSS